MVDRVFSLDKQQIEKIEQIALDQDEKEALNFITEINKKLKANRVGCDPLDRKMREGLDNVVSKFKR